jgi:hypothetical protein
MGFNAKKVTCRDQRSRVFLSSKFAYELVHSLLLLLHRFDQLELGAAPVKVVGGVLYFEVNVTCQEVGEETEADFKGDELASEGEVPSFGLDRARRLTWRRGGW